MPNPFALRALGSRSASPARTRARRGFEVSLVRPSMRALARDRPGCAHCRRTPLVGESVFYYGHALVCELCRPLRREPPAREEVVYSSEHGQSVKRAAR